MLLKVKYEKKGEKFKQIVNDYTSLFTSQVYNICLHRQWVLHMNTFNKYVRQDKVTLVFKYVSIAFPKSLNFQTLHFTPDIEHNKTEWRNIGSENQW